MLWRIRSGRGRWSWSGIRYIARLRMETEKDPPMMADGNHRSAESRKAAAMKRYLGNPRVIFEKEIERQGQIRGRRSAETI